MPFAPNTSKNIKKPSSELIITKKKIKNYGNKKNK